MIREVVLQIILLIILLFLAVTGKTVIKTEIPWSKTPSNVLKNETPDLYICYIGDQPMTYYDANVEPQTACFIFGPDIDKRYYLKDTSPSTWAPAMAFGYQRCQNLNIEIYVQLILFGAMIILLLLCYLN